MYSCMDLIIYLFKKIYNWIIDYKILFSEILNGLSPIGTVQNEPAKKSISCHKPP